MVMECHSGGGGIRDGSSGRFFLFGLLRWVPRSRVEGGAGCSFFCRSGFWVAVERV